MNMAIMVVSSSSTSTYLEAQMSEQSERIIGGRGWQKWENYMSRQAARQGRTEQDYMQAEATHSFKWTRASTRVRRVAYR